VTAILALGSPFAAAAIATVARRRVGAWASWLLLLALAFLYARFGIRDDTVWWNEPGFLSDIDEAVGVLLAAATMALVLQSVGRIRPSAATLIVVVGVTGVLLQWAIAASSQLPETMRVIAGNSFISLLGIWLLGLLIRDFARRRRARRLELAARREA